MHVRAADSRGTHVHQTIVWCQLRDGTLDEPEVVRGVRLDCEVLGLAREDVCHFRFRFLFFSFLFFPGGYIWLEICWLVGMVKVERGYFREGELFI